MAVCERWAQALTTTTVSLTTSGLSANDFGVSELIDNFGSLVTSSQLGYDHIDLSPAAAQGGRVAAAYISLVVAPRVSSFSKAFAVLEPNGASVAAGRIIVADFITNSLNRMIAQNFGAAFYEFTRQATVNQGQPTQRVVQGVVMSMVVNLIYY